MSTPRGIPSVTYLRINNISQSGWTDVVSDGPNSVTVHEVDKVNISSFSSHLYLTLSSCIRLDFAAPDQLSILNLMCYDKTLDSLPVAIFKT